MPARQHLKNVKKKIIYGTGRRESIFNALERMKGKEDFRVEDDFLEHAAEAYLKVKALREIHKTFHAYLRYAWITELLHRWEADDGKRLQ